MGWIPQPTRTIYQKRCLAIGMVGSIVIGLRGTIIMMETWKKHRLAFSVSLSACFFMSDVLPHWRTHPHQGGPALLAILEWTLADTAAFVMFQLCLFFVVGKIFAWGKRVWNGKRQGEF